jgi:hypothetical protein
LDLSSLRNAGFYQEDLKAYGELNVLALFPNTIIANDDNDVHAYSSIISI